MMDDKQLRDEILALAASTSTSSNLSALNGTAPSSTNASGKATPLEANPTLDASSSTPLSAVSKTLSDLISSTASLSISTSSSSTSSVSPLSSSAAIAFAETEEKFLLKALTTHFLLRRLGYTRSQADVGIIGAGSLDLEDCLSYLTLILSEEELEEARKSADRGEIRRDPRTKKAEEEIEDDGKQKQIQEDQEYEMDSDDEPDETQPPSHPGFSFTRTTASRAALQTREAQMQEAQEEREKEEAEEKAASISESSPSPEIIRNSSNTVRTILASISETLSTLDTLEEPTSSWAMARVAQIQIDRCNSQRFKTLGKRFAMKDLDHVSSQMGKVREEIRSLLADSERQPSFDRRKGEEVFRSEQLKKDDEEFERRKSEEKREKERREAMEPKLSEEEKKKKEEEASDLEKKRLEEEEEKKRKESLDPYGQANHDPKNEIDLDPEMNGNDSDSDGEPLFGDMLDETPTEVSDIATGIIVQVKTLPAQAKGGGGGKTGRTLLSDALKRVDPYAQSKFEPVSGGGRVHRSRLTLRWRAPGSNSSLSSSPGQRKGGFVDTYTLTSLGCVNQNQADDLLAIVALTCMDKDKPTHRALGPGFREWYEEIDDLRKEEKDGRARRRIERLSEVLKDRIEEAREKKNKAKNSASALNLKGDDQADVGTLARGNTKESPEHVKERIRETFKAKVEGKSYQEMLVSGLMACKTNSPLSYLRAFGGKLLSLPFSTNLSSQPQRQSLPIFAYRDHILSVLDSSQIFVLSGETGKFKAGLVPSIPCGLSLTISSSSHLSRLWKVDSSSSLSFRTLPFERRTMQDLRH